MSSANEGIKFWYNSLAWDDLDTFLISDDKKNLMEFSLDFLNYLESNPNPTLLSHVPIQVVTIFVCPVMK